MILYPNAGWPNKANNGNSSGVKRTTIMPDKVAKTAPKSDSGKNTAKK